MFVKDKHLKQFWSVEFNHLVKPSGPKIFAAVGGPKVSIFEITPESKIKFLHCFVDEDVSDSSLYIRVSKHIHHVDINARVIMFSFIV